MRSSNWQAGSRVWLHRCGAIGCPESVPTTQMMCAAHWAMVHPVTQGAVVHAFHQRWPMTHPERATAVSDAIAQVREGERAKARAAGTGATS